MKILVFICKQVKCHITQFLSSVLLMKALPDVICFMYFLTLINLTSNFYSFEDHLGTKLWCRFGHFKLLWSPTSSSLLEKVSHSICYSIIVGVWHPHTYLTNCTQLDMNQALFVLDNYPTALSIFDINLAWISKSILSECGQKKIALEISQMKLTLV